MNEEEKLSKYRIHAILAIAQFEGLKQLGFYDPPIVNSAIKLHKDGYYACPNVHSGLMSPKAYNNVVDNKQNHNTDDHFHSRTLSSETFHKHYEADRFTLDRIDRVEAWYKSRCRVHTVTRQENRDLIAVQNDINTKGKHYTLHYDAVGIKELVPRPNLRHKNIFLINDVAYNTAQEAGDAYGISATAVYYRCKTRKWNEWKKISKKSLLKSYKSV